MTPIQRVVLVGLMGAGKSTVGPLLAHRLGWRFLDLDGEIERLAGQSVPEIFSTRGEAGFRQLEAEATAQLAGRADIVIAAGGGWMAQPEMPERLGPGTFIVWLQVTPRAVLARLGTGDSGRPMLAGAEPAVRLEQLWAEREAAYSRAHAAVGTDGLDPADVAAAVEGLIRRTALVKSTQDKNGS
ncbi:shikimate kinase [soil metagenome]